MRRSFLVNEKLLGKNYERSGGMWNVGVMWITSRIVLWREHEKVLELTRRPNNRSRLCSICLMPENYSRIDVLHLWMKSLDELGGEKHEFRCRTRSGWTREGNEKTDILLSVQSLVHESTWSAILRFLCMHSRSDLFLLGIMLSCIWGRSAVNVMLLCIFNKFQSMKWGKFEGIKYLFDGESC